LAHMSISTYFRPNIHQNGPEILGVKAIAIIPVQFCTLPWCSKFTVFC
jgi:hypothetical protein